MDALSWAQGLDEIDNIREDKEVEIIEEYKKMVHRRVDAIYLPLTWKRFEYWKGNQPLVKKVLKTYIRCKKYNVSNRGPTICVNTYKIGERGANYIIGSIGEQYIIMGIEYFTRKAWVKAIKKKTEAKIIKILEEIYSEITIRNLVAD